MNKKLFLLVIISMFIVTGCGNKATNVNNIKYDLSESVENNTESDNGNEETEEGKVVYTMDTPYVPIKNAYARLDQDRLTQYTNYNLPRGEALDDIVSQIKPIYGDDIYDVLNMANSMYDNFLNGWGWKIEGQQLKFEESDWGWSIKCKLDGEVVTVTAIPRNPIEEDY